MTALSEYERLEASGIWRGSALDQRRDVVVSLGDATLAIYDMQDRALAHWSLAAVERRNLGASPAVFAPGPDEGEMLELDDDSMIAAIERVRRAITRSTPRRGRLRYVLMAGTLLVMLWGSVFWL